MLDVKKRKRKLFAKNPPYKAMKVVIPKTAVFERLTVYSYGKRTDYRAVKEHLKAFSKSVILCQDSVLPVESGIFEFSSADLKAYMTFNSLERLLDGIKEKRRISLVIADRTGDYSSFLERAVLLAGRVTVLTDNKMRYCFTADEIYETYGAVISIQPFSSKMPECDVFISLSNSGVFPLSVCVKNRAEGGYIRLTGSDFTLPESIKRFMPSTVNPYAFASALFTLSNVRALGKMGFDSFNIGSRRITAETAVKMLDTLLKF